MTEEKKKLTSKIVYTKEAKFGISTKNKMSDKDFKMKWRIWKKIYSERLVWIFSFCDLLGHENETSLNYKFVNM